MPSTASAPRAGVDACPGVLTLHEAADGGLARIRIPGGRLGRDQLGALVTAAEQFGDGGLELTSRGNLQLRGVRVAAQAELGDQLGAAGLLPSATHERVRNIIASPLAGIDGVDQLGALVERLDGELCARAELAELPGRFLFALDDGRGDVARMGADITAVVQGERVVIECVDVPREAAVDFMLALAAQFLDVRAEQSGLAWRVAEIDGGVATLLARLGVRATTALPVWSGATPPIGIVEQPDGGHALVVVAPLGRLDRPQLEFVLRHAARRGVRVTPWRSVVVPDLVDADRAVAEAVAAGLGVDADSPWLRVSSCVGRPGCDKALADVRADARAELDRWPGRQVRWSGCERQCGRPLDTDIDMIATRDGYDVVAAPR